jgi:hypothetical protein
VGLLALDRTEMLVPKSGKKPGSALQTLPDAVKKSRLSEPDYM